MENKVKYDVTDLTSLEKLEPVRVRPGMYIGSTGTKGLHHCIWEILDNSIDEISNGYGNKASVIFRARLAYSRPVLALRYSLLAQLVISVTVVILLSLCMF